VLEHIEPHRTYLKQLRATGGTLYVIIQIIKLQSFPGQRRPSEKAPHSQTGRSRDATGVLAL